jgi:predicted dehydrogenase
MLRIGIIGMGFMGGVHLNAWQHTPGATVVAACDSNPVIQQAKGNIDTGADGLNLEGVTQYTNIAEMLESESLDAVSITLPSHLHKAVSIQCLEAGVHVLCEKPMALALPDCQAMIDISKKTGKELMVAHCIRFWPEYAWLKKAVEEKTFGTVLSAEFDRRTSAPAWSGDSWFADPAKSGGIALDLHIHDLDVIQYLFGLPESISASTADLKPGFPGYVQSQLQYKNLPVTATASWLMPESFGFHMGFEVVFENAAAVFDGQALRIFSAEEDGTTPALEPGDGYLHEIRYFADRISGRTSKLIITPQEAAESVRLALETVPS